MQAALIVKDNSDAERLVKISPYRKEVRKTAPHRHKNYFEIIYFSEGAGTHTVDHLNYEVRPPVIFFVRRDQVHHFDLDDSINPDGYVLIVKTAFVQACTDPELKHLLASASAMSCLYLNTEPFIGLLFDMIARDCNQTTPYPGQQHCLEGLMKALLVRIIAAAQPALPVPTFRTDNYSAFRELLGQAVTPSRQVAYYAGLLNTSPQNLNAVCRKQSGQSASQVIAEFIISEARRLLVYTNSTISEIAFQLNFTDASHFVKYFKRHSGSTPQTYRRLSS